MSVGDIQKVESVPQNGKSYMEILDCLRLLHCAILESLVLS